MRNFMTAAVLAATASFACPCLDAAMHAAVAPSDQVAQSGQDTTFYRVPLMCHAARGLGCGSRAKPVLLDLQKKPNVQEVWLNHTGEILAVVWKPGSHAADRQSVVTAVADAHGVSMDELDPTAREAELTGFRAGTGWHRGTEVDQLSAQEARVIAARLLRRVSSTTPGVQRKMATIQPALTEAIRRQLVGTGASAQQCRDALLASARPHLDKSELAALKDALGRGFQPVGDEQ